MRKSTTDEEVMNKYLELLEDRLADVVREHDKTLLTISSAAIGTTVAFYEKLNVQSHTLLIWTWGFWTGCIFLVACSFGISQMTHRKTIKQILAKDYAGARNKNAWDKALPWFDTLAFVAFTLGVILFIVLISTSLAPKNRG